MNFDLDIKNYDKGELQKLLKLGETYSNSDVERSCNMLQQRIADNSEIDLLLKSRVNNFLTSAKNILVVLDISSGNSNPTNSHLLPSQVVQENGHMIVQPQFNGQKINYNLSANLMDGRFNPLFKKSVTKMLTIDSKFRDNYFRTSASDFRVNLPMSFNKVINMSVTEVELPLTFYAISRKYGNDYFWICVKEKGDATNLHEGWYFIRIPEGNYNHEEIIRVLNTQLTELAKDSTPAEAIGKYFQFKINLSQAGSGDGKTILAGATAAAADPRHPNTAVDISIELYFNKQPHKVNGKPSPTNFVSEIAKNSSPPFDPTPLPLKLGWNLGFRFGDYKNPAAAAGSPPSAFVSQGLYEALGPRYIYLVVDDYNNNVNNSHFAAFNSSILNKNILARISIQGSVYSILSDASLVLKAIPREYFGPIDIQKLQIQLLDEYGRVLDLNNMDFSFALKMECMYNN